MSVTLRNRSDCTPTRPTTQVVGLLAVTVSTRIGLAEQRSREDLSWGDGIRVCHQSTPR